MRAQLLLIPVLFIVTAAIAQDSKVDLLKIDDVTVSTQLRDDKEAFVASMEKARGDMLKSFDRYAESMKANKSFVEAIEAEKKAFEKAGALPNSFGMKVATNVYRAAEKRAELECMAAFDRAAKACRDKGDLKAAAAILDEAKKILTTDPVTGGGVAVGDGVTGGGGEAGGDGVVLVAQHSGKVLAPSGAISGVKVLTANYVKGEQNQLWKVVAVGEGYVYIESVKTGMVMTTNGKENGVELIISKKRTPASDSQLWKLTPVVGKKDVNKIFAKGTGRVIGVAGKYKEAGLRILLWDDEDEPQEMFGFFVPK